MKDEIKTIDIDPKDLPIILKLKNYQTSNNKEYILRQGKSGGIFINKKEY